ncbi:hypothetical protein J437_LFUL017450 [Ladona fulva]|uniref:Uncharacterized protein n=1 Tax=Ladona fulva TaxID=123851 RepID=A0A8K0P7U8_LADFU|nr:hypothetical protein J437_LFUL017450 [Ladona fulva]
MKHKEKQIIHTIFMTTFFETSSLMIQKYLFSNRDVNGYFSGIMLPKFSNLFIFESHGYCFCKILLQRLTQYILATAL